MRYEYTKDNIPSLDGISIHDELRSLHFELDGHRIFVVQAADDQEGWIEAPLVNLNDHKFHFDRIKDDFCIVRKFGKVCIFVNDPFYARIDEDIKTPLWETVDSTYPFAVDILPGAGIP